MDLYQYWLMKVFGNIAAEKLLGKLNWPNIFIHLFRHCSTDFAVKVYVCKVR